MSPLPQNRALYLRTSPVSGSALASYFHVPSMRFMSFGRLPIGTSRARHRSFWPVTWPDQVKGMDWLDLTWLEKKRVREWLDLTWLNRGALTQQVARLTCDLLDLALKKSMASERKSQIVKQKHIKSRKNDFLNEKCTFKNQIVQANSTGRSGR